MSTAGPAFQEEVLRAHNECRKKHNTSQVTWSNDLAGKAQKWANQIAKKGKFQHAPSKQRKGEGENIACAKGKELTGDGAVMMWYNEIDDYKFTPKPAHNPNCGHFTQVVWKTTKEIGAGRAKAKNGTVFVVCRYKPAGNMLSDFPNNINAPVLSDENMNNAKKQTGDGELIVPVVEAGVCSAPVMDVPETENQQLSKLGNSGEVAAVSSVPSPNNKITTPETTKPQRNRNMEMFEFTFERKLITREESDPEKPRLMTREVSQLNDPVRNPAYQSREEIYLKTGNSYHVTHNCYADLVIDEE